MSHREPELSQQSRPRATSAGAATVRPCPPSSEPSSAGPSAPPGAWFEPAPERDPIPRRPAGRGPLVAVAALVSGALRMICARRR